MLLNNGSSLYMQMKSNVFPDQYYENYSWWTKQEA